LQRWHYGASKRKLPSRSLWRPGQARRQGGRDYFRYGRRRGRSGSDGGGTGHLAVPQAPKLSRILSGKESGRRRPGWPLGSRRRRWRSRETANLTSKSARIHGRGTEGKQDNETVKSTEATSTSDDSRQSALHFAAFPDDGGDGDGEEDRIETLRSVLPFFFPRLMDVEGMATCCTAVEEEEKNDDRFRETPAKRA